MTTQAPPLQQFVERSRTLYSLPAVALEVLELTSRPQVDNRALKKCIENDPALTSKVLRVVNSSLYGLSREVSDLSQALALLGVKPLKLLVLGFSLSEVVFSRFTGKVMLRFWRHTLTKAVASREIAETICHIPGDEPFIAALLQDIGMLVLLQELGEPYARLLSRPFASQNDLATWEVQSLGFDHTELSARLLAHWGLPESLQLAVALPRGENDRSEASALARILHLSNLLADLLVDARHDLLAQLLDSTAAHSRLTHAQLSALVDRLQDKVAQLADVFSLELPPGLDYRDVLNQAQARMADVSIELATEMVKGDRRTRVAPVEAARMLEDVQELAAAVTKFTERTPQRRPDKLPPKPLPILDATLPKRKSTPEIAAPEPVHTQTLKPELATPHAAPLSPDGEAGLTARLSMMIYACRQSRWALSLAIIEVDRFAQFVLDHGPQHSSRMARLVHEACQSIDVPEAVCVVMRPYVFALGMPNCDRQQAAKVCTALVQEIRKQSTLQYGNQAPVTVSVGLSSVDLPPKNFSAATLYESASRCLSSAQLSGGNTLKSIGIY